MHGRRFGRNLHVSVFPQAFRGSRKEEEGLGPAKTDYRLAQNLHLPWPTLFTETGCVLGWVKEKYVLKDLDQSHSTLLLYITLVVHVQSGPRWRFISYNRCLNKWKNNQDNNSTGKTCFTDSNFQIISKSNTKKSSTKKLYILLIKYNKKIIDFQKYYNWYPSIL